MKAHPGAAPPSAELLDVPPLHLRIFVNRNLRMDTVRAVGLDMDYTLARYRREKLEELAHRLTIDKLVARGYPEEIREFQYDKDFVIRGLTVDKQTGNILKLDRHNHVARVFNGRRRMGKKERRTAYRREKLDFRPPRFALVDTLFSLPEMCLYADLVDLLRSRPDLKLDTWQLFDDTRECIDEAHRDDTLKSIVVKNLDTYVERDPLLGRALHKLRSSGKQLFLLTNSLWDYTDALMSYLLDDDLPEYPKWQSYFEVIVVGAKKPAFFSTQEPLAEIDATTGQIVARPVERFERGRVYQGGNLKAFEAAMKVQGEDVLYVGDHIYGDVLSSKKSSLWRAALIVEELEDELRFAAAHRHELEDLARLETERRELDDLANVQRRHLSAVDRDDPESRSRYGALRRERDATIRKLRAVIKEMHRLQTTLDEAVNKNWGMVFKEDHENSRFGEQVSEYACLYTSRVTNFLNYSAYQYFRSPRDFMPHERALLSDRNGNGNGNGT